MDEGERYMRKVLVLMGERETHAHGALSWVGEVSSLSDGLRHFIRQQQVHDHVVPA